MKKEMDVIRWKRPVDYPYPNVWHRYETKLKNGVRYKIKIQDVDENRTDEVCEFMTNYFYPEEPLSKSLKLTKDETSFNLYFGIVKNKLRQRTSLMATLNDGNPKAKIVGVMILFVATEPDSPLPEGGNDAYRKIKRIIEDTEKDCDPFQIIGSNVYIQEWGLAVMPEFRGYEIGYNILDSISRMATAFRIPGAMIMSSKIETQILADRLGFKTYKEIVYDDYHDDDGNVIFTITDTKSLKFMGIKYQL